MQQSPEQWDEAGETSAHLCCSDGRSWWPDWTSAEEDREKSEKRSRQTGNRKGKGKHDKLDDIQSIDSILRLSFFPLSISGSTHHWLPLPSVLSRLFNPHHPQCVHHWWYRISNHYESILIILIVHFDREILEMTFQGGQKLYIFFRFTVYFDQIIIFRSERSQNLRTATLKNGLNLLHFGRGELFEESWKTRIPFTPESDYIERSWEREKKRQETIRKRKSKTEKTMRNEKGKGVREEKREVHALQKRVNKEEQSLSCRLCAFPPLPFPSPSWLLQLFNCSLTASFTLRFSIERWVRARSFPISLGF